jgi:hypothetical protein
MKMKKLSTFALAATLAITTLGATTMAATSQDILIGPAGPRVYQQQVYPAWQYQQQRNDYAYWNGHRGYYQQRPGYRQHNGYWYPPEAFAATVIGGVVGGIIGNAIANQGGGRGYSVAANHVDWCESRYRSYRASDNTFQPYNGPRQQCVSPY